MTIDTTKPLNVQIDNIATDLNNKADRDMVNSTVPYIVEAYQNGQSGYNVYSNGYCEQWGCQQITNSNFPTVTLMKSYRDTNFSVTASSADEYKYGAALVSSTSSIQVQGRGHDGTAQSPKVYWVTRGYVK